MRSPAQHALSLLLTLILLTGATGAGAAEIRLSLPPDPNALPIFVLEEKQDRFLPDDELVLVSNPAGDPSAMRAMIQSRRVDFALFNLIGGVRFRQGGVQELGLVTPWVWRGVYLLQPVESGPLHTLDGGKVLVAPGTSTPPHVITERVLASMGIRPEFVTGGAGAVLMQQMRQPQRAPAAVAAPEPVVSLILDRQEKQDWAQRWEIRLDPTTRLDGEIPLGALWAAHSDIDPAVHERLVGALDRVAAWVQDPANHDEAAAIGAAGYRSFFRMPVPESTFHRMLETGRVQWSVDTGPAMRETVDDYLSAFGIQAPTGLFVE